jgi:hypothetical protein
MHKVNVDGKCTGMHLEYVIIDDVVCYGNSVTNEKAKAFGDYFRDLSANYSEYQASGKWPARPEGLVIVAPLDDVELARTS